MENYKRYNTYWSIPPHVIRYWREVWGWSDTKIRNVVNQFRLDYMKKNKWRLTEKYETKPYNFPRRN